MGMEADFEVIFVVSFCLVSFPVFFFLNVFLVISDDNDDRNEVVRIQRKRSVIPIECVKLISEYLTWEYLSKKLAVPFIINHPSLFRSCSLNNGMTNFEYFAFRKDDTVVQKEKEGVIMKEVHLKMQRMIVNRLKEKASSQAEESEEREKRCMYMHMDMLMNLVEE